MCVCVCVCVCVWCVYSSKNYYVHVSLSRFIEKHVLFCKYFAAILDFGSFFCANNFIMLFYNVLECQPLIKLSLSQSIILIYCVCICMQNHENNGVVSTHAFRNMMYMMNHTSSAQVLELPKCILVITGKAHCFNDSIHMSILHL